MGWVGRSPADLQPPGADRKPAEQAGLGGSAVVGAAARAYNAGEGAPQRTGASERPAPGGWREGGGTRAASAGEARPHPPRAPAGGRAAAGVPGLEGGQLELDPTPSGPGRTRPGYGGAAEQPRQLPARLLAPPRRAAPRNRLPAPPPLRLGTTHSPVADHHALDGLHGRGAGRRQARPRAELRRNAQRRSGRGPESRARDRRQPSAAERRVRRQPSVRRRGGARGELRRGRSPSQSSDPEGSG